MQRLRCKRICRPKVTTKNLDRQPESNSDCWMPALANPGCSGCAACAEVCPTGAITLTRDLRLTVKYDACIACRACIDACPTGSLVAVPGIDGATSKDALKRTVPIDQVPLDIDSPATSPAKHSTIPDKIKIFAKSMHVREVDCGSCNACELEIAATGNPVYDAERFGIYIVASPRHADVLFVTGPVTRQMELALRKTDAATPTPKLIVAVGTCACSGGLFGNTPMTGAGVDKFVDVDLYIPGCPPSPRTILRSILALRSGAIAGGLSRDS